MSNLPPQQALLADRWAAIHDGAARGIEWIGATRADSKRLDSEADDITLRLHRARNTARVLGRASTTPMGLGFFGLSQAGKSYLISALAAGENGKLETRFDDELIDFLVHVNPTGGGKEATGLVTRFTHRASPAPAGYPIALKIFNEVEIAKILVNSYFNDFNHQQITYHLDEERIEKMLARFEGLGDGPVVPGVTADDVVSLWDYAHQQFSKYLKKLELGYWQRAMKLAPRLSGAQRAELFSILWDELPQLTRLYTQLANTLRDLGHPESVQAPLEALVARGPDGLRQVDSIMNVDTLSRLGSPGERSIRVMPMSEDKPGAPVSLTVGQLAALTAELIFPLINESTDAGTASVDLLDFPGYRARLRLLNLDEHANADMGSSPTSQVLLRGKVAYLFERYTDNQEMNGLVICTASDKQSDVTEVGGVLTRWINKTQGASAAERGSRDAGLIWAITMLDKRVGASLEHNESQLKEGWDGMMQATMLERFADLSWMQEWKPGKPFDNTYLVRKPRMATAFLDLHGAEETGIRGEHGDAIQRMAKTFPESPKVQRHINQPAEAWAGMMAFNDGGIGRIKQHVIRISDIGFKLQRIQEQLDATLAEVLGGCLSRWYHQDGGDEVGQKRAVADMLWKSLQTRVGGLGEFIKLMELPREILRDLYLSGAAHTEAPSQDEQAEDASPLYGFDNHGSQSDGLGASPFGDSPFGDSPFGGSPFGDAPAAPAAAPAKARAPELQSVDHRYAKAVFAAWTAHLRQLPQRPMVLDVLRIEKQVAEAAIDEIITAANRLKLQERLSAALLARAQSGAKRDQLVERQALIAHLVTNDFVSWLGYLEQPVEKRPSSFVGAKDKVFRAAPAPALGELPVLEARPVHQALVFLGDWLSGLTLMTIENAGHSEGREISIEQNERLGLILKNIQSDKR